MRGRIGRSKADAQLRGKVVVITGASSGLGRALAIEFASRGSVVALGARRADALEDTARECHAVGGYALWQVTDVTVEDQVKQLAEAALSVSGRIDVWVNNAGVTCFARLADGPMAEHRRVIETNVYGAIYGGRAVVPVFRRQREGVLINIGSVLTHMGQPFVPSYVISKYAISGVSQALAAEVTDQPGISICSLYPYAMDTEHFESGANHYGHPAHPMPPLQSPEKVARVVVQLAKHPRRVRYVPRAAALGVALHSLVPSVTDRLVRDALSRWHFGADQQPDTVGNLFRPRLLFGAVHGTRLPTVGTSRLLSWALLRLLALSLSGARRRLWRTRGLRKARAPERVAVRSGDPSHVPGAASIGASSLS